MLGNWDTPNFYPSDKPIEEIRLSGRKMRVGNFAPKGWNVWKRCPSCGGRNEFIFPLGKQGILRPLCLWCSLEERFRL